MRKSYDHVVSFALDHPWAITRPMLQIIAGLLARRIAGRDTDQATIDAALVNRKNLPQPQAGSVAIIPVYGVLAPRVNMMSDMSGGTTFEKLTAQLRETVANKSVKTIVLDVDSPGGNVAGATEFCRELMRARTRKPIVAVAQYTMASAAYWISSCATEIVAAPSATIGSIGVYTSHEDLSKALEMEGVKVTYISAGQGKVDGNEAEPLSDEALARFKTEVDKCYAVMVNDIVRGRGQGMTPERVRNEWKAFAYSSADALALGMVDKIATLDETVTRLLTASPDESDRRAAAELFPMEATDQEPQPAATSQEPTPDLAELERAVFALTTGSLV